MKRDKRVHTITLVCLKIEVTDRNKKDRIKVWEKHIFNFEIWVYFVLKHTYAQLHPSLLYSVAFASSAVNFTVNVPKTENFPLLLSVWPTFIPEELSVLSIIWSFASTHIKSIEQKDAESDKKKARFLRTQFHFYFFVFIYGKHRKMLNKYLQNIRTVLRHLKNQLGIQKISTKVKAMLNNKFAMSVQLFPIAVMWKTNILQNSQGLSYF